MAKNGTTRWVSIIITLVVLGAGVVSAFALVGQGVVANADSIRVLNEDGSKPTRKNCSQITLIKYRLDSIDAKQTESATKQEEGFNKILDRLPE